MANRSDFFNAKLPRQYKRMLAMGQTYGWTGNEHSRGLLKRQFISAHANHVNFKLKRQSAETNSSEE
jgi:hypothetical protein